LTARKNTDATQVVSFSAQPSGDLSSVPFYGGSDGVAARLAGFFAQAVFPVRQTRSSRRPLYERGAAVVSNQPNAGSQPMAKTKTTLRPSVTHLLALVVQTNEQVGQLSLLMDTRASLEDPLVEPVKRGVQNAAPPDVQRAVLKQTLNDEMRRQLKVLSLTVDALYDCTDRVTSLEI
jgi:hypothetical protein